MESAENSSQSPDTRSVQAQATGDARTPLKHLSIDLEVDPKTERIFKIAAVRSNSDGAPSPSPIAASTTPHNLSATLARIDKLANDADCIVGHNIILHDLPRLRAAQPDLNLLWLPVVDTLRLNPLAYPRNPYHHLVKHYQDGALKRGQINDPELDAKLTLTVLDNQIDRLSAMSADLLAAYHWLTTRDDGAGFDLIFTHIRRSPIPSTSEALEAVRSQLDSQACPTAIDRILQDTTLSWEMAYTLAWITVSGGNSVVPPWVRHQFPETNDLIRQLRDTPCSRTNCDWCAEKHDPDSELRRWFGFDSYREEPLDDSGAPMQRSIVHEAMMGNSLLAILPTGAGKSLCYQVPALSRHEKTGALTVIISPLTALMQDQVDGLKTRGIESATTVNGMLSMPERADALDRVRLGDASILIISPEQLRSPTTTNAINQREIAAWVLDEAHCLSKWGHDFRPDYQFIGRHIRESSEGRPYPPILCLTATAKPDVIAEISKYFRDTLETDLKIFNGGVQRPNLRFLVAETSEAHKSRDVWQMLQNELPKDDRSGAIVYCSTRKHTEELAQYLNANSIQTSHFHAGLPPESKAETQRAFISGELRVITATNAFGMGIDKPDIRLIIHADIPGSLENYIQEAGRAGRDQRGARCVLFFTKDDVERQFGMSARSRLQRHEIHAVLRALRNLRRRNTRRAPDTENDDIVATPGEILSQDDDREFDRDAMTDDNRVRTALLWLEESDLLTRNENRVKIFPSSLRVNSLEQARQRLSAQKITSASRKSLLAVTEELLASDPDDGVSTDQIAAPTGIDHSRIGHILHQLETHGIATNDTVLTAFVHAATKRSSNNRFEQIRDLETGLLDLMAETAPDLAIGDTSNLHLRGVSQQLRNRGAGYALPDRIRKITRGIANDGRGHAGGGSLSIRRSADPETMRLTLQREWSIINDLADQRRNAAKILLDHLLAALPPNSRGADLLVETTMGKLLNALRSDLMLRSQVREPENLMNRALMWLHEQEIVRLNQGLTVLRPAMTIKLRPGRRQFGSSDYEALKLHYDEQTLQIHIMSEYANRALRSVAEATRLALDYFALDRDEFIRKWLPDKRQDLQRQTTPESWQTIVESLNNPVQRRIVVDNREQTNVLVLAGPGSGKTRALVHRIAYLIRARRENPRGILALAYNRHAAVQIRRRLAELIGADAKGVIALTCHALAMRLTGASFHERADDPNDSDFSTIIREATDLLRGEGLPPDESDEYRARLLGNFRWILVDEYQDIDSDQYDLISALAGRTRENSDDKLSLFAVGDDDQNIYSFKGASVKYIRKFEEDYKAKPLYLTDNYRSTPHIISASNTVIEPAGGRMKSGHPIHVDKSRRNQPPGGDWTDLDQIARGRVHVIPTGDDPNRRAQAAIAELERLSALAPEWDWAKCAVISRNWADLNPVRNLCSMRDIPAQIASQTFTGFWRLRETQALLQRARAGESQLLSHQSLNDWLRTQPDNVWNQTLRDAIQTYSLENPDQPNTVEHFTEWLAEWGYEMRRHQTGLLLTTAHSAKGLEFDHVVILDGDWQSRSRNEDPHAQRRLYYVAMTRARQTLALTQAAHPNPFITTLRKRPQAIHFGDSPALPSPHRNLNLIQVQLNLRDVFISYAGRFHRRHHIHRTIARLSAGDPITVTDSSGRWTISTLDGTPIGRLARTFKPPPNARLRSATVMAIATWNKDISPREHRRGLKIDQWEVIIPQLIFEPDFRKADA